MEELELNTLVIYEDLGLSSHAVAKLEHIRDELHSMSVKDRSRSFRYGRLCCQARDTIHSDGGSDSTIQMFCDSIGVERQNFYSFCKLFEVWEPYEPFLANIGVRVQRYFSSHKLDEELLKEVVAIAKMREVTYAEFCQKMLRPETQRAAEIAAEQDEDWDQEDEEEEVSDQEGPAAPPVALPTASDKSLEAERKRFIGKATKALRQLLADINTFCSQNRLKKGEWYETIEDRAECLLQALDSWKRVTRL